MVLSDGWIADHIVYGISSFSTSPYIWVNPSAARNKPIHCVADKEVSIYGMPVVTLPTRTTKDSGKIWSLWPFRSEFGSIDLH